MRPHYAHARLVLCSVFAIFAGTACGEFPFTPDQDQPTAVSPDGIKPLANHVTDQVDVDINNYALSFAGELLLNGNYKGTPALFAGGLSYANASDAAFLYNPRGTPAPSFEVEYLEIVPPSIADNQTLGFLKERVDDSIGPSNPIGLSIVRETFAYVNPPDDDYVIVKYSLNNPTGSPVNGLHVGEVLDIDLANATQNFVEYVAADMAARTTASGTSVAHAHILLSDPVTSYRGFCNSIFGPCPGSGPTTLAGWFAYLSVGIVDPEPYFQGSDVRELITTGPVNIPAGGSLAVFTALVGGDDTADLSTNIAAARAKYGSLSAAAKAATAIAPITVKAGKVKGQNDLFEMKFTFDDVATASLFDSNTVFCGKAPAVSHVSQGVTVTVTFDKNDLSPRLRDGDLMSCGGVLTDGRVFAQRVPARIKNQFISTVTQLTTVGGDRMPSWSPDGTRIVFSSDRGGDFDLWTMDVAGGEATATNITSTPAGSEFDPDWSPDGATIMFRRNGAITTVPAAGGTETGLTDSSAVDRTPRWSPDGSQIAFRRRSLGVWAMGAAGELGGSPATSISYEGFNDQYPDWAPDGLVYFLRFAGLPAIFSVDPDNPAPGTPGVQVTPVENAFNHHPAVSPDGSTLAFISLTTAGIEIILQDLATGEHSIVLLDTPVVVIRDGWQNLEFSPDGTHLLFTGLLENVAGAKYYVFMADVSGLR